MRVLLGNLKGCAFSSSIRLYPISSGFDDIERARYMRGVMLVREMRSPWGTTWEFWFVGVSSRLLLPRIILISRNYCA